MSSTVVQRHHHIHIPWMTIVIVLVAALAAAGVLVLINQPADVTVETTPVLTAPGAVAMPQLETHAEILALTGRAASPADVRVEIRDTLHNFPVGTLESSGRADAPNAVPDTRHNFPAGRSLD